MRCTFVFAAATTALLWFAVPWFKSFVRHLYLPVAPPDGHASLVPTTAGRPVLEPSQGDRMVGRAQVAGAPIR